MEIKEDLSMLNKRSAIETWDVCAEFLHLPQSERELPVVNTLHMFIQCNLTYKWFKVIDSDLKHLIACLNVDSNGTSITATTSFPLDKLELYKPYDVAMRMYKALLYDLQEKLLKQYMKG